MNWSCASFLYTCKRTIQRLLKELPCDLQRDFGSQVWHFLSPHEFQFIINIRIIQARTIRITHQGARIFPKFDLKAGFGNLVFHQLTVKDSDKNYHVIYKEILAVKYGIKKFQWPKDVWSVHKSPNGGASPTSPTSEVLALLISSR